jgi:ABC-type multidrug transport system ATPase subunit
VVIMAKGRIVKEGTIEELTPRTGRVSFAVRAGERDMEALVSGLGTGFRRTDEGFDLDADEDEQNAVIDRVRAAGVSILGMTQRKLTLEDAFIDIVGRSGV